MTEQFESLEIKLSKEEYQAIYITSIKRNISLQEAMSLLIIGGARVLVDEEAIKQTFIEALEPTNRRLESIEAQLSELIQIGDTLPCWSENQPYDYPVADADQ
jgi:hypothetical protein